MGLEMRFGVIKIKIFICCKNNERCLARRHVAYTGAFTRELKTWGLGWTHDRSFYTKRLFFNDQDLFLGAVRFSLEIEADLSLGLRRAFHWDSGR